MAFGTFIRNSYNLEYVGMAKNSGGVELVPLERWRELTVTGIFWKKPHRPPNPKSISIQLPKKVRANI